MRTTKWWTKVAVITALVFGAASLSTWLGLTHEPDFYRRLRQGSAPSRTKAEARQFVARGLQLRNDIMNEPLWQASFSDEEVNSWLAEDLLTHFADQVPPGIHEPRVAFESERVTLAFEMDQGPVRSVVWVVARPRILEPNVVALTLEKIRAGLLPIPPEKLLEPIRKHAAARGIDLSWKHEEGEHVAIIRYAPGTRSSIVLERVEVDDGRVTLSGRSTRSGRASAVILPNRRMLRTHFPNDSTQPPKPSAGPLSTRLALMGPLS